eukprot:7723074-Pyramimonas_sp.AAC.1
MSLADAPFSVYLFPSCLFDLGGVGCRSIHSAPQLPRHHRLRPSHHDLQPARHKTFLNTHSHLHRRPGPACIQGNRDTRRRPLVILARMEMAMLASPRNQCCAMRPMVLTVVRAGRRTRPG